MTTTFRNTKMWKGNTHCHTSNSDGVLSSQEVRELYKQAGYNFLVYTDHNRVTDTPCDDPDFITFPGIEVDICGPGRIYHCVGIGSFKQDNEVFTHGTWQGLSSVQRVIDDIEKKNMAVVLCHPNWSRLELSDFIDLNGYFGLEIFNFGCAQVNHTGLCVDHWDSLLRRGRRIWGLATDDYHGGPAVFGGWVNVAASSLSRETIIDSLIRGSFYSSSGPEIYEYQIHQNVVSVKCSPVKAIHFVCFEPLGQSFVARDGLISSASYKLKGNEEYVRVECIDERGRTAWTNPIFLHSESVSLL